MQIVPYAAEDFARDGLVPARRDPEVPFGAQDLGTLLDAQVAATPNAHALAGTDVRYTFAQLEAAVRAATAALESIGVRAGSRVAASLRNHPDIIIAFLASQRLNAVWVGINRSAATVEKSHMLKDAEVSLLLATPAVAAEIGALACEFSHLHRIVVVDPDDSTSEWQQLIAKHKDAPRSAEVIDRWRPATISYTSGTTGFPKGVVQNQHNLALCIAGRIAAGQIVSRSGVATALTIVNIMITAALTPLATGGSVLCIERLYLPEIVACVERERLEMVSWVPTLVYDLLDQIDQYQSSIQTLRTATIGTMHVPEELRERFRTIFGDNLIYAYGLTEAPCFVAISRAGSPNPPGASGKAAPHLAIEIRDSAGRALEAGEIGEIWIGPRKSGPWAGAYTPMLGYWRNPAATAETIADDWARTGDLGSLDIEGNLTICGRIKEMIIRGGANIYSAEVERVLGEHQDILSCAVIGKPDKRLGEVVAAIVQLKAGVSQVGVESVLREFCGVSLAKYKVPEHWLFVDHMPLNDMGKVRRTELRKLIQPSSANQ